MSVQVSICFMYASDDVHSLCSTERKTNKKKELADHSATCLSLPKGEQGTRAEGPLSLAALWHHRKGREQWLDKELR